MDVPLGRQGQEAQWQRKRHSLFTFSQPDPGQIDMSLLGTDHDAGHDGLSGADRKPHKSGTETLQLICFQAGLETPLLALRKQEQQLVTLEHLEGIGMGGFDAAQFTGDIGEDRRKFEVLPVSEDARHASARSEYLVSNQDGVKSRAARMIRRNDGSAFELLQVLLARDFDSQPAAHGLHRDSREDPIKHAHGRGLTACR